MALLGMRGLSTVISDVRNCQNKEAERWRVDKELVNICIKFKNEKKLESRTVKPPRFLHDEDHADASKVFIESSHHDLYQRPWNQQLAVSTTTTFEHGEGRTWRRCLLSLSSLPTRFWHADHR